MSFQAYLDHIQAKTGKSPEDFKRMAEQKNFTQKGVLQVKATEIVAWLKKDFALGHGHCMAIYCLLKDMKQTRIVNGKTRYLDEKKK